MITGSRTASSNVQPRTVRSQPLSTLTVYRHDLVDLIPEGVRVIEVVKVTQLMHDDVVDDRLRRHHTLPVKSEVALGRARCPLEAEFSHSD